jgi:hypothetical protein
MAGAVTVASVAEVVDKLWQLTHDQFLRPLGIPLHAAQYSPLMTIWEILRSIWSCF